MLEQLKRKLILLQKHSLPVLLFFVMSLLLIFIFPKYQGEYIFYRFNDITFHTSRMLSIKEALLSPTDFDYFQGMNIPVNLMYPWLFVLPWYILYNLCQHDLYFSYIIYSVLILFVSCLITYYVGFQLKKNKGLATAFAIVYTFAFYHLYGINYRVSIGENLSAIVMPLLILALYRIFCLDRPKYGTLVVTMTLICYMHNLSLFIYSLFIAIVMLVYLLMHRLKMSHIIALVKASFLTLLCGTGSVGVMAIYSRLSGLSIPQPGELATRTIPFDTFFDNIKEIQLGVGAQGIEGFIFILGIISLFYFAKASFFEKIIIGIGWISLFAALPMFDWVAGQFTIFSVIQFPWRFFAVATLCFSYTGIIALFSWTKKRYQWIVVLALVTISLTNYIGYETQYNQHIKEEVPMYPHRYQAIDDDTLQAIVTGQQPWQGSGRYDYSQEVSRPVLRYFEHHYMRIDYHYVKTKPMITNQQWIDYVTTNKKTSAIMPVFANQGTTVYVNGKKQKLIKGFNGGVEVQLAKGENRIVIQSRNPWYVYILWFVSLLSIISCIIIYYRPIKLRKD